MHQVKINLTYQYNCVRCCQRSLFCKPFTTLHCAASARERSNSRRCQRKEGMSSHKALAGTICVRTLRQFCVIKCCREHRSAQNICYGIQKMFQQFISSRIKQNMSSLISTTQVGICGTELKALWHFIKRAKER